MLAGTWLGEGGKPNTELEKCRKDGQDVWLGRYWGASAI